MATNATRKRRGRNTELDAAEWLRLNGWPHAEAVGSGAPGADITGTPGIAWEVKARTGFNPGAWLKQARGRPGLAIVLLRLPGAGPVSLPDWPVMMCLSDVVQLLRDAGYGEPYDPDKVAPL